MTDNITLRRDIAVDLRNATKSRIRGHGPLASQADINALAALDAALAEPKETFAESLFRRSWEAHRAALAEPEQKPEPVHPGYIIGSHWLETAYSRIAAGEAEADVLAEVLGARGWAKREPATDATDNRRVWDAYIEACREFERFHGIRKEDK
jgi:hypothetical protein